jgi:hypothetical protein
MTTLTLRIENDDTPCNPRKEYDNAGKMVCFHRNYILGDETTISSNDFNSWDDLYDHLVKEYNAVNLYDHSGITMRTTPFSCRWDSGQVGFIYMDRKTLLREAPNSPKIATPKAKAWARGCLKGEVETYDQYLNGDVWGYIIEDEDENEIESCWGFFGREYAEEEGEAMLAYLTKQAEEVEA